MNPFYIEQKRIELHSLLPQLSERSKLIKISDFYSELILSDDRNLINAYLFEFSLEFLSELKKFNCIGLPLQITEKLLAQITEISIYFNGHELNQDINNQIERIEQELDTLREVLYGSHSSSIKTEKISFPVLVRTTNVESNNTIGSLESVTIVIKKTNDEDKFILVPSSKEINEDFIEQIKRSFLFALDFFGNNKKFSKYHEVLIYFQNREAFFEGSSHGVSLAIGFIEELCNLYNLNLCVSIKNNITSTGLIDIRGKVLSIKDEIIIAKVELIFFSAIEYFIIPKANESMAQTKLDELKTIFPNRNLKLIPIENISDIFNYRNIIAIDKKSIFNKIYFAIKKNWILLTIILLLISIFYIKWHAELDSNPKYFERNGSYIYIKSNTGKLVHKFFFQYEPFTHMLASSLNTIISIVDVNNDYENEIITAGTIPQEEDEPNRIACRDKNLDILWEYDFQDTISSPRERLKPYYSHKILDTCTINNQKLLAAFANNVSSYSGAIFFLDYKNGMRVGPTFWHQGHVIEGKIKDIDNDSRKELIFTAFNNGLEKIVFGILPLDDIHGQSPSTEKYMFNNWRIANFKFYSLLPNTDYNQNLNERYMTSLPGSLNDFKQRSLFSIVLYNKLYSPFGGLEISIDYNLSDIDVIVGSDFRVLRDSLVVNGKLKYPLTDTPEYTEIYKNRIQFWDGTNFIFYHDWVKLKTSMSKN